MTRQEIEDRLTLLYEALDDCEEGATMRQMERAHRRMRQEIDKLEYKLETMEDDND